MSDEPPPRSTELAATRVIKPTEKQDAPAAAGQACLIVIVGPKIGLQIPLASVVEMGRDPSCTVAFDSDMISRRHARVEPSVGGYEVIDLGSTNGTYVNDVKVSRRMLRDGDRVGLGKILLKFLGHGNIEAEYHREIYHLMTFDGLTGVSNKRHFNETLENESRRTSAGSKEEQPMSVIVFDVDHFKNINDTLGHAAGDAVLRQLAQCTRQTVPEHLMLGRVGGEEFAVLAVGVPFDQAVQLGEQLRAAVEANPFHFEQREVPVTVSVGVATRTTGAREEGIDIFKRADEALYRAKQSGRNKVCS